MEDVLGVWGLGLKGSELRRQDPGAPNGPDLGSVGPRGYFREFGT